METCDRAPTPSSPRKWLNWAIGAVVLTAGVILIADHREHVLGILPYLLILACPLMHLFGHRHGGRHDGHSGQS